MRPRVFLFCCLLGAGCSLTIYPPAPGDEVDATAHLSIDGRELPLVVEPGSGKRCDGHPALPSSRARFASDGAARVVLRLGATRDARLRAAGRDVRVDAANGSLAFVLDRPDHYVLRVAGRRFYFWVDPLAALARPAGAASYDAQRRPGDWLARALDAGPVALEAGLHRSPAFRIPSRGELHLAPGAVLRYDGSGGGAGFVTVRGENVTVGGVGTIDASDFGPGHNLLLDGATHVRVRDVFFTKSRWWALRIRDCDDVALDRVKVFSGTDGVDVDASRDVSIRRAFVHAWDDAIAIKATVAAEARGVLAEHCLVSSRKSAFKIGTETLGDIRDVTVRRCDAFETARGVLMVGKDGGRIGDVLFEDLSIQLRAYANEPKAGRPIVVELMRRLGSSRFRTVWKSKFYGVFVLNRRVVLQAIDAMPHPAHWLISTQVPKRGLPKSAERSARAALFRRQRADRALRDPARRRRVGCGRRAGHDGIVPRGVRRGRAAGRRERKPHGPLERLPRSVGGRLRSRRRRGLRVALGGDRPHGRRNLAPKRRRAGAAAALRPRRRREAEVRARGNGLARARGGELVCFCVLHSSTSFLDPRVRE